MSSKSRSSAEKKLPPFFLLSILVILICGFFLLQPFYALSISIFLYLVYLIIKRAHFSAIFFIISYPIIKRVLMLIFGENLPLMGYYPYLFLIIILIFGNVFFQRKIIFSFTGLDFLMASFLIILLISIFLFSSDKAYGLEKFLYLIFSLFLFYLPLIFSGYVDDPIKYFEAVFIFGLIVTVYGYFEIYGLNKLFLSYYGGRLTVLGLNPIWVSRYLSYAILVEIFFILKFSQFMINNIGKVISLFLTIFLQLILVIKTGSRGPILGLALGVAIMLIVRFKVKAVLILAIILILMIFFAGSFIIFPQEMTSRILTAEDTGKITVGIRIIATIEAIQNFWNNKLFGIGFGSYYIGGGLFDALNYPHNIFTEILAETGLIGFSLLSLIVILSLKTFFRNWQFIEANLRLLILGFLISTTVNACLSGNIGGNRFFWFSLGIAYFTGLFTTTTDRIDKKL